MLIERSGSKEMSFKHTSIGNNTGSALFGLDDAWVQSLKNRLKSSNGHHRRNSDSFTIFTVPPNLRKVDNHAYKPKIVSFGPYHRGKEEFKAMEEQKWLYLHKFLDRNTDHRPLDDYLAEMKACEEHARGCYSEEINMGSQEFAEMMLLDSCFILELILMQAETEAMVREDVRNDYYPVVGASWVLPTIAFDMLLLENQIPMFVLDGLFGLAVGSCLDAFNLSVLILQFFDRFSPFELDSHRKPKSGAHHLLHLFHLCVLPTETEPTPHHLLPRHSTKLGETELELARILPSATELLSAGIEIQPKHRGSFHDLTFDSGEVLRIRRMCLDDHTNTLFYNLIAFEQCWPMSGAPVTTYTRFMKNLVETPRDAKVLRKRGIMANPSGSDEEVVRMFRSLCKGAAGVAGTRQSCLAEMVGNVRKRRSCEENKGETTSREACHCDEWPGLATFVIFMGVLLVALSMISKIFAAACCR